MPLIRGPLTHRIVPGDVSDGRERPYKWDHLTVTTPTLPVRSFSMGIGGTKFMNALPATFVPMLVGGQGGAPEGIRINRYLGIAASELQPVVTKPDPWE